MVDQSAMDISSVINAGLVSNSFNTVNQNSSTRGGEASSSPASVQQQLPSPSKGFLQFKKQAEDLFRMAIGFSVEEKLSASIFWDQLKSRLVNLPADNLGTGVNFLNPIQVENARIQTGGRDNSLEQHVSRNPVPSGVLGNSSISNIPSTEKKNENHIANSANDNGSIGSRSRPIGEFALLNNMEPDLGPTEELLLHGKSSESLPGNLQSDQPQKGNIEITRLKAIRVLEDNSGDEELRTHISTSPVAPAVNNSHQFGHSTSPVVEEPDPASTWKCKYCPEVFTDWITFQNHKPSHKKAFKCDRCDGIFATRGNFNVHYRIHTGAKPFVCPKCSARFNASGNLRRHLLTHQGLKPYNCSLCSAKFTEKKSLLIHQRSRHTGERPFICSDCGQGFSQSSVLNSHRLIHSDAKPFTCCKCGHRFRQKSQLRLHENRHAGLKNYSCSHSGCTVSFVTKADLDRHMRGHDGEKLSCGSCGTTFMRKYNLKKHVASKHS